jgi:putative heme-binding domain-containing protein
MLDMYRETIEHPHSIPEEIKAFLDLTSGHDRGRIFRLVSPDMSRLNVEPLGEMPSIKVASFLNHENAWHRMTAMRLLNERQDKSVEHALTGILERSEYAPGRVHSLYALKSLQLLKQPHIQQGLKDEHPRVRAHAVMLSEPFLAEEQSGDILNDLLALCDDPSEHVRFQLAFTLGESSDERAIAGLARLALDARNDADTQTAILSSVSETADKLATHLIASTQPMSAKTLAFLSETGQIAGANPTPTSALTMLSSAAEDGVSATVQRAILNGLGKGLAARGSNVSKLLSSESATDSARQRVIALFARAVETAEDKSAAPGDREAAIRLLAFADESTAVSNLPNFLSPQTPPPLQRAAVTSLSQHDSNEISKTLLANWKSFSPQVRQDVVDALVVKTSRIQTLLEAVESATVLRSDLTRDRKQLLMNHPNSAVSSHSRKLFGDEVNSDRAGVVAEYQDVLTLDGNAKRGQAVFRKICSACHRAGGFGQQVAPDLASVKNKSDADLLVAILDPNREAQPNFNVYTIVTEQGRVFNGIIAAESAGSVTLKRAEGKEDVILRSNIDQMISTGLSLMPVGLEKDLKRQDLADVIAFVKSITAQPSSATPGR